MIDSSRYNRLFRVLKVLTDIVRFQRRLSEPSGGNVVSSATLRPVPRSANVGAAASANGSKSRSESEGLDRYNQAWSEIEAGDLRDGNTRAGLCHSSRDSELLFRLFCMFHFYVFSFLEGSLWNSAVISGNHFKEKKLFFLFSTWVFLILHADLIYFTGPRPIRRRRRSKMSRFVGQPGHCMTNHSSTSTLVSYVHFFTSFQTSPPNSCCFYFAALFPCPNSVWFHEAGPNVC